MAVSQKRYQLIPRTLIFIKDDENYLLIHRKKENSFGYDKLNGVGGHIEMGEEPFESAQREVAEETGVRTDELELTAILFINVKSNPGIQVFVFKAVYISGKLINSHEGNLKWMTKTEIMSNKQVLSDVLGLIEICEDHKKGKKPIILKYSYDDSGELRIVN